MNLEKIKTILISPYPEEIQEKLILDVMSEDNRALEYMLFMLDCERKRNSSLITEMNLLVAQSETIIENPKLNKDKFMSKKILDFYEKHKDTKGVFHCFDATKK